MGEKEPREDPSETHGIRPNHRLQVEAQLTQAREEMDALGKRQEEPRRPELDNLPQRLEQDVNALPGQVRLLCDRLRWRGPGYP